MAADRESVRPPVALLTDDDAREIIAKPLRALCSELGPTRVAKAVGGVDEKTIRRARDEQSTLCLETAANLLLLDGRALDGFLGHFGRRSVPIGSICDTDALPALTGAVHQLVVAASPASPGGIKVEDSELFAAKAFLLAAQEALEGLILRAENYENRGHGKRART